MQKSVRKDNKINPSQNPSAIRSKKEITDTLLQLMNTYSYNDITVKQIIFTFCFQNQELLIKLRDNNLIHLLLHKWNIFIPMMHNQIVSPNYPLFRSFTSEQIDYIIAFNIGAIWNVIMKWIEYDMKESPEQIKATLLKYLSNLMLFT